MNLFRYCPLCTTELMINDSGLQVCANCRYKNYDSPVPAVAGLVTYEGKLVLVQRNVAPFIGEWCLPCGFVNSREDPAAALIREVQEETGLTVKPTQIALVCNPASLGLGSNQIVIHYLTEVVGGQLSAGDDAKSVDLFTPATMPKICFRTHQQVIEEYLVPFWRVFGEPPVHQW